MIKKKTPKCHYLFWQVESFVVPAWIKQHRKNTHIILPSRPRFKRIVKNEDFPAIGTDQQILHALAFCSRFTGGGRHAN